MGHVNPDPPSSGGRPRDAQIDQRVLSAARELLADRGLRAMSLDAVAERAGVARSTIYRRWASSDELILDVIDDALGQLPGPDPTIDTDAFWQRYATACASRSQASQTRSSTTPSSSGSLASPTSQNSTAATGSGACNHARERAINSLQAAAAQGQVDATDADLLVGHARRTAPVPLLPDPRGATRQRNRRPNGLDRITNLAERLLSPPAQQES